MAGAYLNCIVSRAHYHFSNIAPKRFIIYIFSVVILSASAMEKKRDIEEFSLVENISALNPTDLTIIINIILMFLLACTLLTFPDSFRSLSHTKKI